MTHLPGFHGTYGLILGIMWNKIRRTVEEIVDAMTCVLSDHGTSVVSCMRLAVGECQSHKLEAKFEQLT